MSDTELVRDLQEGLADARAGRVFSAGQVVADLAGRRIADEPGPPPVEGDYVIAGAAVPPPAEHDYRLQARRDRQAPRHRGRINRPRTLARTGPPGGIAVE